MIYQKFLRKFRDDIYVELYPRVQKQSHELQQQLAYHQWITAEVHECGAVGGRGGWSDGFVSIFVDLWICVSTASEVQECSGGGGGWSNVI